MSHESFRVAMVETRPTHVLVVDDDPVQRRLLRAAVESIGARAFLADDGDVALNVLSDPDQRVSVVVLDLKMPRMSGVAVMQHMAERGITTPVIVQTAHGDIETVVEAMRCGAFDFVVKPVTPERLALSIENAIKVDDRTAKGLDSRRDSGGRTLVAASSEMERVLDLANRAASSDIPVVLEGESGVGKERIARLIQSRSDRAKKPFITVNCGAIPEKLVETVLFGHEKGAFTGATEKHSGKFVDADGGTLFLDEIGDLPLDVQVKLLRAVQDGEIETVGARKPVKVNVRLISATNRNLIEQVKLGRFREDLYYRLNVFPIVVPPLRNRKEDIPILARDFADRFGRENGLRGPVSISADVMAMLTAYDWPGNVRQLENAIFRAIILCDDGLLTPELFPQIAAQLPGYAVREAGASQRVALLQAPSLMSFAEDGDDGLQASDAVVEGSVPQGEPQTSSRFGSYLKLVDERGDVRTIGTIEEEHIRFALEFYAGQMSEVARRLGIGRSTLYRKIKDYAIDVDNPIVARADS